MGVFRLGQPVMAERLHRVAGAHERAEETDLQRRANGQLAELLQELLHLRPPGQVPALDMLAEHVLAVFLQPPFVRLLMHPVDRGRGLPHQPGSHRLVGQQHVFLDQLVRDVVLHLFDARDAAVAVQPDLHLGEIEVQRTGPETEPADPLRQRVRVMQHLLDGAGGLPLQDREHLLVGEAPLRMDHRRMELRVQHPALLGDEELHAAGQAVHVRVQRAEAVAQRLRQHGDHAVHQVGRVAPLARLGVQRGARLHVMRHIGDVHPQPPLVAGNPLQADRVVEILRVVGVDGDHRIPPAILPPGQLARRHVRPEGAGFLQRVFREPQRQAVLAQHRKHVHPLLIRGAEDLDDFAFGIGVARLPLAQLDDDLVAHAGGPAHIPGRRHVYVVRHPRVVGDHVKEFPAPLQRAHDLRPLPLQDADHRARLRLEPAGAQPFGFDIPPHEDAILVERGGRRAGRDGDLLQIRVLRLQEAFPLAVDPDAPGDQVRRARQDVAVPLGAGDPPGLRQIAQGTLEFLLAAGRQPQEPQQLRHVGRDVIGEA